MGLGKQIQVWEGIPLQCHPKEYHCSIVFRGLTTDNERTIKSLEFLFFFSEDMQLFEKLFLS